MLDRLLEDDIDFGAPLMLVAGGAGEIFTTDIAGVHHGNGCRFDGARVVSGLPAFCLALCLAARLTQCCFILVRLRRGLAGVLAIFGGRLFQKDRAYEFQQGEHAAHQYFAFTGKALFRRQSLEFVFQAV